MRVVRVAAEDAAFGRVDVDVVERRAVAVVPLDETATFGFVAAGLAAAGFAAAGLAAAGLAAAGIARARDRAGTRHATRWAPSPSAPWLGA